MRQDSLKAQMDWLVALEDADPDLEPMISSGAQDAILTLTLTLTLSLTLTPTPTLTLTLALAR